MTRSKRIRYLIGAVLAATAVGVATALSQASGPGDAHAPATQARPLPPIGTSTSVLKARFAVLSRRHSNQCALRPQAVESLAVHGRLQGSCCTPMVYAHYARQVRALASYRAVVQIPRDPYDIPVAQARQLLAYDRQITLTPEQRAVYHTAMRMADEHGPCCCHCWRWTTFEGQAKYLIAKRAYTANEIATVWDLEDGCGG